MRRLDLDLVAVAPRQRSAARRSEDGSPLHSATTRTRIYLASRCVRFMVVVECGSSSPRYFEQVVCFLRTKYVLATELAINSQARLVFKIRVEAVPPPNNSTALAGLARPGRFRERAQAGSFLRRFREQHVYRRVPHAVRHDRRRPGRWRSRVRCRYRPEGG